jgi:hypothetical protein
MLVRIVFVVFLFCLPSIGALSQVTMYKCLDADGNTSFSSQPCPAGSTEVWSRPTTPQSATRPSSTGSDARAKPQQAPAGALTAAQKNAARSAVSYLDYTGFSRLGLIDQLSSEYGDGYDRGDAARAVDSLNVNWNAQAVRVARKYLAYKGFSCNGLIEQLSSEHGDQFTASQARYGARMAGAC